MRTTTSSGVDPGRPRTTPWSRRTASASRAAMPELPNTSLAWEDLSAVGRRALTEMLVDKIIIERHPSKIDKEGRHHYLIRAIPAKILSKKPSGSRPYTRLGSRSSKGLSTSLSARPLGS